MGTLSADFWNQCYLENTTGWDLGAVSPPIKAYIDTLQNKDMSILIPGCGNAHEAEYLLEQGFTNVTLVDISNVAVERLKEKFKGKKIQIINSDFFNHFGKYDLMIEQTFFCALDIPFRAKYVQHASELLNDNGILAGLLFNCDFGKQGPPFGGNKSEYKQLFSPYFEIKKIDTASKSVKPRLGNELFIEFIKKNKQ